MNTQLAIERVLQDFTKELLRVFSAAVVQAVSQVGSGAGSTASLSAGMPTRRTRATAAKGITHATRGKRAAKEERPGAKRRGRPLKNKFATPTAKTRRPRTGKSSPEEVAQLGSKIVDVLKKADRNMTSKEIMKAVGMLAHEEGRFTYAFNKLKEGKVVIQHGERRLARYGIADASTRSEG